MAASDAPPGGASGGEGAVLGRFFLLTWLLVLLNASRFLFGGQVSGAVADVYGIALLLSQAVIYLLPAVIPVALLHFALGRGPGARALARLRIPPAWPVRAAAVLAAAALQMLLYADSVVFRMYGFHFNGFVLNLVRTPGGLESMGADASTMWTIAGLCALALAAEAAAMLFAVRHRGFRRAFETRVRKRLLVRAALAWLLLTGGVNVAFGLSDVENYHPILRAAPAFPLTRPLRFRGIAEKLGVEVRERAEGPVVRAPSGDLRYPLAPLRTAAGAPRWNVVWLVAESWRFDMLDPEIMPETSAFAARCVRFDHHFSGGNGTRMGMFSMFYGLYGPYWFPFLAERRGPLLMDHFIDGGWQVKARTSARFTSPEFDQTVWARVPSGDLVEGDPSRQGWENDRVNVTGLLKDIDDRDPARPFFSFMFFESPHARYYFPEECAIRRPYLETFNYATMDPERDMELIHARFVNSCRHLDTQFARVFRGLEERGLLDSTIVIVTGDHGEEFMERGRWGHHSGFNRFQTEVPLLLRWPGCVPGRVERMTSHLDLPATVLGLLGVENPPGDYSLGESLVGGAARESCVVSGWDDLAWRGPERTIVIPMQQSGFVDNRVLDADDRALPDDEADAALRGAKAPLQEVLKGLARFRGK